MATIDEQIQAAEKRLRTLKLRKVEQEHKAVVDKWAAVVKAVPEFGKMTPAEIEKQLDRMVEVWNEYVAQKKQQTKPASAPAQQKPTQ